jgi:RNA polymerase sigma-70 factor (ECF subfamily)
MKGPSSQERDLVNRARQHDEAAFAALVDLFTPALFRIVRRMVVDKMEAEAITQETFWRFWQALPRYREDRPLLPYLATIASNLARDRYRRDRRLDEVAVEDLPAEHLKEEGADPEQLLEDEKTLQRLAECVQDLPFVYRAVIALRYEAGMSYQEVAAAQSLPLNTVRTHLRRAKDILRRRLEEADDG